MSNPGGSDEVELLGVEETVRRNNLPAIVVAVLLAVGMTVLLLQPSGDGDQPATSEGAPSQTSTTTIEPARTGSSRIADGPLLGEKVGLTLIVGSVDSNIRTLDLDSGVLTTSDTALFPRFVDGGRLVAVDNWGRWFQRPLAELATSNGTEPEPVAEFRPVVHVIDDPTTDGMAWARTPGTEGRQVWRLVELGSNRIVEVVGVPADAYVPESSSGPLGGPDIVGSLGAGVFERTADGEFVQRHPGRLVAVGQRLLLLSTCDSSFQCELVWLDRSTFDPVDIPSPVVEAGDGFLVGDDSILVIEDRSTLIPVTVLVDVATGRTVRSAGETALDDVWISPDGRWLARPSYGDLLVRDLQNDSVHSVQGLGLAKDEQLIWAYTDQDLIEPTAVAEPSWAPLETPDVPASHPQHGTD